MQIAENIVVVPRGGRKQLIRARIQPTTERESMTRKSIVGPKATVTKA